MYRIVKGAKRCERSLHDGWPGRSHLAAGVHESSQLVMFFPLETLHSLRTARQGLLKLRPSRKVVMRFKLIGAFIGLAALLLGMGVAYGLPASNVLASGNHRSEKSDSDSSKESKDRGRDASKPRGGHGAAVSVAAHCLLKGAAHGALVRSIASDKRATPTAAVSACKAAGGKEGNGPGNSDWAHKKAHGKSDESHGKGSDAA
jgi:hypothetical protein